MRVINDIPLNAIRMDRTPLDPKTFMYACAMLRGDKFPPIRVARADTGGFEIRDGRHRVAASRLLSKGKIAAKFSTGILRSKYA